MREAFGGTLMIQLMMIFIVLYVCFLAVAFNYAKAFKAKDIIVDNIERCEGYNDCAIEGINSGLSSINYFVSSEVGETGNYAFNHSNAYCTGYGYCIEMLENYLDDDDNEFDYGRIGVRVITFVPLDFFSIGSNFSFLKMNIPNFKVTGDVQIFTPFWNDIFNENKDSNGTVIQ